MSRDLNVDQIKKLWVLDLVIRLGSLKKAALAAKVTPSAISQTLTSLENSFGKPLLVRDQGSVTATQDALHILQIVRPAFEAFERLKENSQSPAPKITWMNLGTYESIAVDILPGLIYSFRQKLPNLKLGLRISRTSNLLSMLRKGELCAALITEVDDLEKFYARQVGVDRMGIYISNRHPIKDYGWTGIEKFGLGSLAPGKDGLPRYFTKFLRQFDLVKPSILSDSFETLRATAAAGAIAAVLPERVAQRQNDLIEIFPTGKPIHARKEKGQHKIFVVSTLNCDREETDFITTEVSRLYLNSR